MEVTERLVKSFVPCPSWKQTTNFPQVKVEPNTVNNSANIQHTKRPTKSWTTTVGNPALRTNQDKSLSLQVSPTSVNMKSQNVGVDTSVSSCEWNILCRSCCFKKETKQSSNGPQGCFQLEAIYQTEVFNIFNSSKVFCRFVMAPCQ